MTRGVAFRPTGRALTIGIVAAVLGATGSITGRGLLVWFAVTLGLLLLLVAAWALMALSVDRKQRASRSVHPAQLIAGETARTRVSLPSPPPLSRVRDSLPTSSAPVLGEEEHAFAPPRRGHLRLGPVILDRVDPFRLFRWRVRVRPAEEALVWPRTDAVDPGVFHRLLTLALGPAGAPLADLDDLTLREYRPGDPLSRVYWKRREARGELLVRYDEPGRAVHIDLALFPGAPNATEAAVAVLAAGVVALSSPDLTIRFIAADDEASGSAEDLLNALALTPATHTGKPLPSPQGVVIIALADPTPAAAESVRAWVAASAVEPESVYVLACAGVQYAAREVLSPFTVFEV